LEKVYPEYRVPPEQMKAFAAERTAALLGKKTADRHNLKIGDRVTIIGDIFPVNLELTIRGIFDHKNDRESLVFRYDYLNESLPDGRADYVSTFIIKMRNPEDAPSIMREVDGMFRNATLQTKTETEKEFERSFLAFLGNVKLFLLSICAAVTFTILLVAGNTMAMSVRERVREVGILKTLGFTPGAILGILIGESVAISLIGGLIGVGLAHLVCAGMRQMPSMFANMNNMEVPPQVAAICLGVAAVIGLISCLVPAWTAARRPIVESLRFTD
jgi:putative ABC transport system permease protein